MFSLSSLGRSQNLEERRDSDSKPFANVAGGIALDTVRVSEFKNDVYSTPTMQTQVVGGDFRQEVRHGLPTDQINVHNGFSLEEEHIKAKV